MIIDGQKLRQAREAKRWTQPELAEKVKSDKGSVWKWENEKEGIGLKKLAALELALDLPKGALNKEAPAPSTLPPDVVNVSPALFPANGHVRVLGCIPAGHPVQFEAEADGVVDACGLHPAKHFALRVRGESMAPKYLSGDTVYLEQVRYEMGPKADGPTPIQCWTALEGCDVACLVNGECTLKRFTLRRQASDYLIILQPLNPEHPEIRIGPGDSILVQGIVVKLMRDV